jgi:penicillin amidase
LERLLSSDSSRWSWGRLHRLALRHPLSKLGPTFAEAFDPPSVPAAGDGYSPNQSRYTEHFEHEHGASYRQLFDLADWDRALATQTPGQSGQPGSPHYADLLPLWERGEYFPLAFSRARVEELARHRLLLVPGR